MSRDKKLFASPGIVPMPMEGQTREESAVTPTTLLMGQILVVFGIVICGTWIATQWTAAA